MIVNRVHKMDVHLVRSTNEISFFKCGVSWNRGIKKIAMNANNMMKIVRMQIGIVYVFERFACYLKTLKKYSINF